MKIGLILGDQLSLALPSLRVLDPDHDLLLMAEVAEEATYVRHHVQKIALIFAAMRHFANDLQQHGWKLSYHHFDPQSTSRSLLDVVRATVRQTGASELVLTQCGECRLQQAMDQQWSAELGIPVTVYEDDRFICRMADFRSWAEDRKQLRMEYFYRQMRRQSGLLMDNGEPVGGQWNFDSDNRQRWRGEPPLPVLPVFTRDAIDREVMALVQQQFADHPGSLDAFHWPVTRAQALAALDAFVEQRLPWFGDYQDAMVTGEDFLFHSLLSAAINIGLLTPMEVCQAAEQAWREGRAPLNAVEGFIRQIIGWREYVRGIYWLLMPDYAGRNALANHRPLPRYFWDGQTDMHCMAEAFRNTFRHAYAHHIQRLMVTGNFALLTGLQPQAVCDWYLAVYADAFEWVELPNTLGMVMHADGGVLGSKPYAASGQYIQRMSDYCQHCRYQVKTADQHDSCPFNSLYWHFLERHRQQFASNPRMSMMYRNLDRQTPEKRQRILARAEDLLTRLDEL